MVRTHSYNIYHYYKAINALHRGGGTGSADPVAAGPIIYSETDHRNKDNSTDLTLMNF